MIAVTPGTDHGFRTQAQVHRSTDTPAGRVPYLDGLRALAALAVLFNHAFQQVFGIAPRPSRLHHLAVFMELGHYAVVGFIVISGFSLMIPIARGQHSAMPGGALAFYRKRARRILPAYWAAVLVTLLLIATVIGQKTGRMFDLSLPVDAGGVISHLLLLQNFGPRPIYYSAGNTEICSVFWTISLEWQIYFFFPLLVRAWSRFGKVTATGLVAIVATGLWLATRTRTGPGVNWSGLNADFYAFFALGMLAAALVFDPRSSTVRSSGWKLCAGVLLGLTLLLHVLLNWGLFPWRGLNDWMDYLCAAAVATLLVAIPQSGGLSRALSVRPLTWTGRISYSVYLLHLPLLALLSNHVISPLQMHFGNDFCFVVLISLSLPLILFISDRFAAIFEDTRRWRWAF